MPSGLEYPNSVAYANNSLYVPEGDGNADDQVLVLNSSTGTTITTITGYGSNNFIQPYGVALNQAGTTIFVLDGGSPGVIYAFTSGWVTAGFVTIGGTGSFSGPEGIAVDPSGVTVYVSDAINNQIDEYLYLGSSFTSSPVTQWSTGVENFNTPSGLVLDSSNNLYVADSGNYYIQVYNYI
jgi:DNA-binding beta-propeller fold protein YncE